MSTANRKNACRNLYSFIRLRLGKTISDREIARRWGMDWKSYTLLKSGKRQVPRLAELEALARLLQIDPVFVFEVARGISVTKIDRLLRDNDLEQLSKLVMAGAHSAYVDAEATGEQLRSILARVADAVFTVDLQGRFQDVNQRFCSLTECTEEGLLKRPLFDVVEPGDAPRLMEALATAYAKGEVHNVEFQIRSQGGAAHAMHLSARRVDDVQGNAIGVQAIAHDITGLKAAEAELHRSEKRRQALLEAMPDMMFRIDREGTFLEFIPATSVAPFVPPEDFLGKRIEDVLPKEVAVPSMGLVDQTLNSKEMQVFEYELPGSNGPEHFEARLVACGEHEVLATVRDVSQAQQLEKERAQNHAKLQVIVDAIPAACILDAKDGTILLANRLLCELANKVENDVIGHKLWEIFGAEPDSDSPVLHSATTGCLEQRISKMNAADGQARYFHRTARPLFGANGEVEQVVEVVIDVTEQFIAGAPQLLALCPEEGFVESQHLCLDREKRRFVRVPVETTARCQSGERDLEAIVRNLGRGGVFVETDEILPVGAEVTLTWQLGEGDTRICAKAVVAWSNTDNPDAPAGMGLRFTEISASEQEAVAQYVVASIGKCA